MKHKKLSGFTLVELIVVMCILSFAFGAILSMFKPVNDMYSETKAYSEQSKVANGISEAIASEVRFAKNVMVIDNFQGRIDFSSVDATLYDRCIILDTSNIRTENEVGQRKKATGAAYSYTFNGSELLNKTLMYSNDLYEDLSFRFATLCAQNDKNEWYMNMRIGVFEPTYDGEDYMTPEEHGYVAARDASDAKYDFSGAAYVGDLNTSLININKNGSSCIVYEDFAQCILAGIKYDATISDPGYYTYIFYKRYDKGVVDGTTSTEHTVTFKNAGGTILATVKAYHGHDVPVDSVPKNFEYDGLKAEGTQYIFDGWTGGSYNSVTEDRVLIAKYNVETPKFSVQFISKSGDVTTISNVKYGASVTPPALTPSSDPKKKYEWVKDPSLNSTYEAVYCNLVYNEELVEYAHVTFVDESGAPFESGTHDNYFKLGSTVSVPSAPSSSTGTYTWENVEKLKELAGDVVVKLKFTKKQSGVFVLKYDTSIGNQWGGSTTNITLRNTNSTPCKGYKITIEYDKSITAGSCWDDCSISRSGKTVTLEHTSRNDWSAIPAGGDRSIRVGNYLPYDAKVVSITVTTK